MWSSAFDVHASKNRQWWRAAIAAAAIMSPYAAASDQPVRAVQT
jgi:hypothetical protein